MILKIVLWFFYLLIFSQALSQENINNSLNNLSQKKLNIKNKNKSKFLNINNINYLFKPIRPLLEFTHEHNSKIAKVRVSENLCFKEQEFLKHKSKAHFPRVAFCFSGGGYRAMIYTLGVLIGLEKINLLNKITYISSLSGSAWAINSWLANKYKKISLNKLKNNFREVTQKNLYDFYRVDKVFAKYLEKLILARNYNPISLWGLLLADKVLSHVGEKKFNIKLSDQAYRLKINSKNLDQEIMPIYNAVSPEFKNNTFTKYNWLEFTPHEISNLNTNTHIPTWSLGRKFSLGKSQDFTPELNLDYLLGIFGSAFEINIHELNNLIKNNSNLNLLNFITSKLINLDLGQTRLYPAKINNFEYRLNINKKNNVNYKNQTIDLLDAGIDFNLPLPALLNPARNIDLIFIIDCSSNLPDISELKKALFWAKINHNLYYEIPENLWSDRETNKLKNITIIKNNNKSLKAPEIVYLPMINSVYRIISGLFPKLSLKSGECQTTNFCYSKKTFSKLSKLAEINITKNRKKIINLILDKIKE